MQLPSNISDERSLRIALEQIVRTISNVTGTFVLPANATSINVVHGKAAPNTVVVVSPLSDNAQGSKWSYASSGGQFTVKFGDTVAAPRTFGYVLFGV